jgi:hypothetical protein
MVFGKADNVANEIDLYVDSCKDQLDSFREKRLKEIENWKFSFQMYVLFLLLDRTV